MSPTDCYPTSRKTNSDGKRNRLNKAASALFHGGRAHAHGLLPWQSVLCRPDRYKLELAGSFGLKIHPLLLFAAKLCHPVSRRDLCSRIKGIKMLSCFMFVAQWALRAYCEHTQEPALSTGVLEPC